MIHLTNMSRPSCMFLCFFYLSAVYPLAVSCLYVHLTVYRVLQHNVGYVDNLYLQ